jgi:hypothetical protein
MTAPRTLEEAELGPEPPTGDFPFWQIWVAKCGIVRFRHQRDAVEAMALVQMVKLLEVHQGEAAAQQFLNQQRQDYDGNPLDGDADDGP